MNQTKLVEKFVQHPNYLDKGAGYLAKSFQTTKSEIIAAKQKARELILEEELADLVAAGAELRSTETTAEGETRKYESVRPLSPTEIKELSGVDDILTSVSGVWSKQMSNGRWQYSINVKYHQRDFYTLNDFKEKVRELFGDLSPVKIKATKTFQDLALFVFISDDHVGALSGESLYGNVWDEEVYAQRLDTLADYIHGYESGFDEIHIVSLGDQLNGWNSQTTRGGHDVKSTSNKSQFDAYIKARKKFYDKVFSGGCASRYFVHDVENSNHSGLDFSYMANKLLEVYLETRYPDVIRTSYFAAVNHIKYGIHTIAFGHGKDEKFMKRPMPMFLDAKTDLFLYQYFDNHGISSSTEPITFFKGDLHSYSLSMGKFGRYINVPSIMGTNDYSEHNFGNNQGGAIMEVFDKNNNLTAHTPLWF
jgi:hypothetical protein